MGKVLLWDSKTLIVVKEVLELPWVIQACFTQDGTRLLTSGSDKFPINQSRLTITHILAEPPWPPDSNRKSRSQPGNKCHESS